MSYEGTSTASNKVFYQIFDQKLRTRVPENHPDAIPRINKKGVQVHERESFALFGKIENVQLKDSDFGKQLEIMLDKNDDGKNPILTVGVESKNGRDILKSLPAVNFDKDVRILPYRYIPEGTTEERTGISIAQQDNEGKFTKKIVNFFFNPETKEYLHKYPTIDWNKATEADKKIYKIQRDQFLQDYLQEHVISRFAAKRESSIEHPDDINPEDIPF